MSSTTASLKEADLVPGAFPSEDTIMKDEQTTHSSQPSTLTGTNATGDENLAAKAREFAQQQQAAHTAGEATTNTASSGLGGQGEKAREFHEQQSAAHSAGGQRTDKYTPVSKQVGTGTGAASHPGQNSEAWTDVSNPETLLRNADGKDAPTTSSSLGQKTGTGHQDASMSDSGVDLNSVGSGIATAATALGLAAKDAFFTAKEAAGPAASSATEQAKTLAGYAQENAVPAANYTAEKTSNAAVYARDTAASGLSSTSQQTQGLTTGSTDTIPTGGALDTANSAATYAKDTAYSAASTAQSYAPGILGEPAGTNTNARDIASDVPSAVKDSLHQTGESPEAAANARAVEEKRKMEKELLGQTQTHDQSRETTKPLTYPTGSAKGLSLEEQLMPDSLTPGFAKVIGTEHDRSFPLGATENSSDNSSWLSNPQSRPTTAGDKLAPQVPTGAERRAETTSNGLESNEERRPTPPAKDGTYTNASGDHRPTPPAKDAIPVRTEPEVTVPGGGNMYKTLSSGTPSGVQL
ncbi:unnamed protein product [Discula destructiva]